MIKTNDIINKAKLLGLHIEEINTCCGDICYFISKNSKEHILLVPDNVTKLSDNILSEYNEYLTTLKGKLQVLGCDGLTDASFMFCDCKVDYIDFSSFDTRRITNMSHMFDVCEAKELRLSSFDTSNVESMASMFSGCRSHLIDISNFNSNKLKSTERMFFGCSSDLIDLTSFSIKNVTEYDQMFTACHAYLRANDIKVNQLYKLKI